MRILFLLTQDINSPSGLGRYLPLASGLARLGHTVHIAALHPDWDALDKQETEINGVQVHYVAPMHVRKSGSQKSYYSPVRLLWVALRSTWALYRRALRIPADILYICKPHPMNSLAGLTARIQSGQKLCLDCDDYEAGSGRFGAGWQRSGVAFFEQRMPRLAGLVTANTHFMIQKLTEWQVPEWRIYYLPNGVDPSRFQTPDPAEIRELRAQLSLENQRVVAFIGSLSLPSHPVDLLIRAFAELHASTPGCTLLVVGGGEDLAVLQEQAATLGISEAIVFTGRVPPEKAVLYYHLADITVDPLYDNDAARGRSPLKMFESWACGVPFVSADVGDRRLLAGDPAAALLVQPGEPHALALAVQRLLQSPQEAADLRARGLERVADFTWDKLAGEVEGVLVALLNRQPQPTGRRPEN